MGKEEEGRGGARGCVREDTFIFEEKKARDRMGKMRAKVGGGRRKPLIGGRKEVRVHT